MTKTLLLGPGDAREAARLLLKGEPVAIPTDTVYGLAAHPGMEEAVRKVYAVKSRPADKALLLLVSGIEAMEKYCRTCPDAYRLAQAFWPGPLTIVLPRTHAVSAAVTAGLDTVGVRCPDSEAAREIIRLAGGALAAPSANVSGMDPPVRAADVLAQLDGAIAAVVDGGECKSGEASTIVELSGGTYRILRQGPVPRESIDAVLGPDKVVRLGITGPTGAGKSTALAVLEDMGALVLDCDRIYHGLLRDDAELKADIAGRFPGCLRDGEVDRKALGAVVFSDAAALEDLSAITGAYVCRKADELEREYSRGGGRLVVYDAIRILEGNLRFRCDRVVGIVAPAGVRLERIIAREGISREYAEARIASQPGEEYYKENCDETLDNGSSDIDAFSAACRERFETITDEIRRKQNG